MGDDQSYYYHRAERELRMAQKAASAEAVHAHYTLANHYLELLIPFEHTTLARRHASAGEPANVAQLVAPRRA